MAAEKTGCLVDDVANNCLIFHQHFIKKPMKKKENGVPEKS